MEGKKFIKLGDLFVYQKSREYSKKVWEYYSKLDYQTKKIMGDQWTRSVDSVGANIAEGYGRYHYLDKNKFYYNARGSLVESQHWAELFFERKIISLEKRKEFLFIIKQTSIALNKLISSQYEKNKKK